MRILLLEPFASGSHAYFVEVLTREIQADWTLLTLPGRHWKWRMRSSAAYFSQKYPSELLKTHDLLLASSFLPLAELLGLVPPLQKIPSLLYFHENQLAYPVRTPESQERDHHFGFTQLVSALAANSCLFNSRFNQDSFLARGKELLSRMPDHPPPNWIDTIRSRSKVIPVPLTLPDLPPTPSKRGEDRSKGPIILWNHRWEHDKNPELFFDVLRILAEDSVPFRLAVCGICYRESPAIFEQAKQSFSSRIVHWGSVPDRTAYWKLLQRTHLVVSCARQEFFGLSVLEATHAGAHPVVPDRLVYPEIYPREFRYRSRAELVETLGRICRKWVDGNTIQARQRQKILAPFLKESIIPRFEKHFQETIRNARI
ncbi:MAG: DUF3524 domain-containing protein [Planctomycetota bacterium]|nr:DUF3524 domain-containing protein [Planctomycetota bacterium]